MFDLQLSESETRLMANALDERLRELFEELVHTDDRALKKSISQRHDALEQLSKRLHILLDGAITERPGSNDYRSGSANAVR